MSDAWTLDVRDGIGWLVFDVPGEKVNTFGAASLEQLSDVLERVAGKGDLRALVITSGKDAGFIAGADIKELARIQSTDDAVSKARAGLGVFGRLERLGVPTFAVIHGACLGGGLEMALACTYRLATTDEKTSLGLPEVSLGILPGWGGTQRLPKLVGLAAALQMILSGKPVDSRKAYKMGLVDKLVSRAFLEEQAGAFIRQVLDGHAGADAVRRRRRVRPRLMRWMEALPPLRAMIFRRAARDVARRTGGHYPAPVEALDVIRRTYNRGGDDPYAIETEAFSRLAVTPVSRHLVWLFEASQRARKARGAGPKPAPVEKAAVAGAGIMGAGIAWALSNAGVTVRMRDVSWEALARGKAACASMFKALVKRRKMTRGQMNLAMHRIEPTTTADGMAGADVAIEAVLEDMRVKTTVLGELESLVGPDAIIASNTSSLPLADLAAALKRPERFVGLHFFNPVNRMPLVEVVPAPATSPEVVAAATALVRRLGKTPVVVGDCPGFLVNRILLPYLVESAWLLQECGDPARIDRALEAFGMPMGPLALVDEVGLDVGTTVAQELERAYGERMKVPRLLGAIVNTTDWKGAKSGTGIYRHAGGKRRENRQLAKVIRTARRDDGTSANNPTDDQIVDRTILIMVNEAARCIEEGVVDSAETLDLAMVMGTGFAPFRGGLLRYADERGLAIIKSRLDDLASWVGDRFRPAPLVARLAEEGGRFHGDDPGVREPGENEKVAAA